MNQPSERIRELTKTMWKKKFYAVFWDGKGPLLPRYSPTTCNT